MRDHNSRGSGTAGLRHRLRLVAAALSAVVLGLALAQPMTAHAASPATKPTRFGIAYGNTLAGLPRSQLDARLDDAVALGARWIRIDLPWTLVQPVGPSSWSWGPYDAIFAAARARGLNVLPILDYTPAWARRPGCQRFTCPPRNISQFATFARAAVKRYAGPTVRTWEVWNEPNYAGFWPTPNPGRYAQLLRSTARAVHTTDPKSQVLLGGLAAVESTWSPGSIGSREFLARVCATGVCNRIDGVAFHPYTYPYLASQKNSWSAWAKIGALKYSLRSVLRAAGDGGLKIWATEYGAPTGGSSDSDHVSEDRQAQIATDAVRTAAAAPNVAALFWYTDQDQYVSPTDTQPPSKEAYFGLRHSDGTEKPAWQAFHDAVAAAQGGAGS